MDPTDETTDATLPRYAPPTDPSVAPVTDKPGPSLTGTETEDPDATGPGPSTSVLTKPIVVQLVQQTPSGHAKPGLIALGTPTSTARDLMLLRSDLSYRAMRDQLADRAVAKDLVAEYRDDATRKIYRRASLCWKQPSVAIDEGNWEAARQVLLDEDGAYLEFNFAVVDAGFEEREREGLLRKQEEEQRRARSLEKQEEQRANSRRKQEDQGAKSLSKQEEQGAGSESAKGKKGKCVVQ